MAKNDAIDGVFSLQPRALDHVETGRNRLVTEGEFNKTGKKDVPLAREVNVKQKLERRTPGNKWLELFNMLAML